jgi:hypothetical protein
MRAFQELGLWLLINDALKQVHKTHCTMHSLSASYKERIRNAKRRIQHGNWGTDADSMSSVNQEPCWDAGAMLGRGNTPGRVETLAPWTPSPWKTSPCHGTLREQMGCHPHTATISSCQLQTCFKDLQQTKQVSAKPHTVSLRHPWDKPAQPPWTDWFPPPCKKKKPKTNLNNEQQNWKLAHSRGGRGCWKHTREGGGARSWTHVNHQ